MEIIILDFRNNDVIFINIPSNIDDIEDYLTEYHNYHSDCYYMASDKLNIIDNRKGGTKCKTY